MHLSGSRSKLNKCIRWFNIPALLHENCCVVFMDTILRKIAAFADKAHGNQQRKYKEERYIEHPLRVMRICKSYGYPLPVLAAAILHDVLEDTATTDKQIRNFLSTILNEADTAHTLDLVIELTDVYTKHQYPKFNRRRRRAWEAERLENISAEAQTIKYADIIDNASGMSQHGDDFAPVFLRECRMLIQKMKQGDANLREKAIEVLKHEMKQLKMQETHSSESS
jgi:(p)ppGpp synthase/HD superfamily hydrolase